MLLGDLNRHLDATEEPLVGKLTMLLDIYSLSQKIQQLTHVAGCMLHVIITCQDVEVASLCFGPPGILSDHSLITAELHMIDGDEQQTALCIKCCARRHSEIEAFTTDL